MTVHRLWTVHGRIMDCGKVMGGSCDCGKTFDPERLLELMH